MLSLSKNKKNKKKEWWLTESNNLNEIIKKHKTNLEKQLGLTRYMTLSIKEDRMTYSLEKIGTETKQSSLRLKGWEIGHKEKKLRKT